MLSICIKAIHVGSTDADPAKWQVTQEVLEREIAEVKAKEMTKLRSFCCHSWCLAHSRRREFKNVFSPHAGRRPDSRRHGLTNPAGDAGPSFTFLLKPWNPETLQAP